ncbi:MAG: hypothetical protein ACHQF2_02410 [Flavobacteriales bacterium]
MPPATLCGRRRAKTAWFTIYGKQFVSIFILMLKHITLASYLVVLTGLQAFTCYGQTRDVTVPKALYPGVLPEITGKNEFISVYVKNNQMHVSYKKIYSLLDSVNVFREFYCRMIQLADSTDESFSIDNSYVSLYIDTSVSFSYVDYVFEELKEADLNYVLLKTRNKKEINVGFYVPLVQMPEKRMSYVAKVYGRRMAIRFDKYKCLYGDKPIIITDEDPTPPPPLPYPPYLYEDLVKKYKQSLMTGVDSAYLLVNWKNNKVFMNNTSYDVGEITKFIERNPKSIFFIEMNDKQSYTHLIKLIDHLFVSYYMVLEDYCQKKFKKSVRDVSPYALREIEKVVPFRYYLLSRAEQLYINDVDE